MSSIYFLQVCVCWWQVLESTEIIFILSSISLNNLPGIFHLIHSKYYQATTVGYDEEKQKYFEKLILLELLFGSGRVRLAGSCVSFVGSFSHYLLRVCFQIHVHWVGWDKSSKHLILCCLFYLAFQSFPVSGSFQKSWLFLSEAKMYKSLYSHTTYPFLSIQNLDT